MGKKKTTYIQYKIENLPEKHYFQKYKIVGTSNKYLMPETEYEEYNTFLKAYLHSRGITEYFKDKLDKFIQTGNA